MSIYYPLSSFSIRYPVIRQNHYPGRPNYQLSYRMDILVYLINVASIVKLTKRFIIFLVEYIKKIVRSMMMIAPNPLVHQKEGALVEEEEQAGGRMEKSELKGLFQVFYTRWGSDYTMGRIVRLESSGKILGANRGKVIFDRKHFSFPVQSIDTGYLNAAGGYAEGRILDRKHFSFLVQVIDRGHLYTAGGYEKGRVLDILEFLNKEW